VYGQQEELFSTKTLKVASLTRCLPSTIATPSSWHSLVATATHHWLRLDSSKLEQSAEHHLQNPAKYQPASTDCTQVCIQDLPQTFPRYPQVTKRSEYLLKKMQY